MSRNPSSPGSLLLLACLLPLAACADLWVHSTDGAAPDKEPQRLPTLGIRLADKAVVSGLSEASPGTAAACGWYRIQPALVPSDSVVLWRRYQIRDGVAVETVGHTNRLAWSGVRRQAAKPDALKRAENAWLKAVNDLVAQGVAVTPRDTGAALAAAVQSSGLAAAAKASAMARLALLWQDVQALGGTRAGLPATLHQVP